MIYKLNILLGRPPPFFRTLNTALSDMKTNKRPFRTPTTRLVTSRNLILHQIKKNKENLEVFIHPNKGKCRGCAYITLI